MPVYHSAFNSVTGTEICGCPILPIKTKAKGPAQSVDMSVKEDDIVDEAIRLFRANVLFRNFEVLGGGDRILMYLTLFIHQCLKKVEKKPNKTEALRELSMLAQGGHFIPGDSGWPLGQILPTPKSTGEGDTLRLYFRQMREGLVPRLVDRIFNEDGTPNKHWMQYSKKKFMNKEFV